MHALTLSNGTKMPALGLGTCNFFAIGAASHFSGQIPRETVPKIVAEALRVGYRHFDCASVYENECEIGTSLAAAYKAGVVKREDLFITSKVFSTDFGAPHLRQSFEDTCRVSILNASFNYCQTSFCLCVL